MSVDDDRVLALLAERNPVPPGLVAGLADSPEAEALLEQILATRPQSRPRSFRWARRLPLARTAGRRRGLLVAAAVLVAAVVLAVGVVSPFDVPFLSRGTPALAATPPLLSFDPSGMPDAKTLLGRLADKAAVQPPAPGSGPFEYVQVQAWSLDSAISGGRTTSALVPTLTEAWTAQDGSGRSRTVRGHAEVERVGSKETLKAVLAGTGKAEVTVFGEGGSSKLPLIDLSRLSTDPSVLAKQLLRNEGTLSYDPDPGGAPVWFQRVHNVSELYRRQVVPPRLQAALLRVLTTTPGLVVLGRGHDRVGRAVVAVGFESTAHGRPARYQLLFDPGSGALRGVEEAVTTLLVNPQTGRDYLNVRIPALVESETYLASGHAPDDRTRP
jgi:hypothetical protein